MIGTAPEVYPGRRRTRLVVPVLLTLAANGCVPHKLYNEAPEQYLQEIAGDQDNAVPAHLAVIEFDDHGVLWKRDQLEDAIDLIRDANDAADDGTLVIVYIHGWKNNADPTDANGALAQSRESVRANAERHPADRPFAADRVVGVFLGCRGDTSDVPVQEQLTFWDRRRTVDRLDHVRGGHRHQPGLQRHAVLGHTSLARHLEGSR